MLRNCPNHDILRHIQVHTFYHGLTDGGKDKLDHLNGDFFLSGTTAECHNLLINLVANHYEKKKEKHTQAWREKENEKDTRIQILERTLEKHRDDLKKEKEDHHKEKERSQKIRKTIIESLFQKILEVFKKLHINILFIEAFEQTLSYVKFMKDIFSKKRRLGDYETVTPKDFLNRHFSGRTFCDLGASINLMPYSIYCTLCSGQAKPTSIILQLANRSLTYPKGVIEDILVKVDKFRFPTDFVVLDMEANRVESLERTAPSKVLKPSIEEPPTLELKPLPNHLRYVYLGESDTLPVIISSSLSDVQVEKLLRVLKDHKSTIGWIIVDIKGINLSFCMHKILLEDDQKPFVESQRRLNPIMKEVVNNEIIKWLDAAIIYPIFYSSWQCSDNILRRCVLKVEMNDSLERCHASPYGGHFQEDRTVAKIMRFGFYWLDLFNDTHLFVANYDRCQITGNFFRRHEMPLNMILEVELFDVWGIDFMGPFVPSFGNLYILVAVDYVSK
ncbi:hypothetical protein CDL12_16826 [Handroanthus impetiginosus]|uniref:DNA-directed DNA polymerase n=1 Tax=Handroanthus impetiginosus TaxID=429701 RepID=A0A2G9GZ76_9LAMI|nr:hypothetical protein CDL12_16826 [Handroanthus impetiginosus]